MEVLETHNQPWKVWNSPKELSEKIPSHFQHGISISSLNLTCLAAFENHLVIGTNTGIVYLIHLPSFNVMKLKCEDYLSCVECVAAVRSVDDMVAAGCIHGIITIFQIPLCSQNMTMSQRDDILNVSPSQRSPRRFTVSKQHQSALTAMTWSRNGMRLFCADSNGYISMTEVDNGDGVCQILLQIEGNVVQLSYAHQMLAISCKMRVFLYDLRTKEIVNVGKKPRVPAGSFGCVFASSIYGSNEDLLYCARPGNRLWSAGVDGVVRFSYIHKQLPEATALHVPNKFTTLSNASIGFGRLYFLREAILASQSDEGVVVVDVSAQRVLAHINLLKEGGAVAAAAMEKSVFVLCRNRNILCLSQDEVDFGNQGTEKSLVTSLHLPMQENLNAAMLSELKSKIILPSKDLISEITKLGGSVAFKITEMAAPAIVPGDRNWSPVEERPSHVEPTQTIKNGIEDNKENGITIAEIEITNGISNKTGDVEYEVPKNRQYEDVVLASSFRTKKKTKKTTASNCAEGLTVTIKEIKSDRHDRSLSLSNDEYSFDDDLKLSIEKKESLLADVLDLDCLRMDHKSNRSPTIDSISHTNDSPSSPVIFLPTETSSSVTSAALLFDTSTSHQDSSSALSYGPPSGSSDPLYVPPRIDETSQAVNTSGVMWGATSQEATDMPSSEALSWSWWRHILPAMPSSVAGGERNAVFVARGYDIFFCERLDSNGGGEASWRRLRLPVGVSDLACQGKSLILQSDEGFLQAVNYPDLYSSHIIRTESIKCESSVTLTAFDNKTSWIVHRDGKVFVRVSAEGSLNENVVCVNYQELCLTAITCRDGVVWATTDRGKILYRIGVQNELPEGLEWGIIEHEREATQVHLSEDNLGWMVDSAGGLYVAMCVSRNYPKGIVAKWWQVGMSDYMFGDVPASEIRLTSNEDFLFVYATQSSPHLHVHSLRSFVGHRWTKICGENFIFISADAVFRSYGLLYCINRSGELFAIEPQTNKVIGISLPKGEKALCLGCRPDVLWVLTKARRVLVRMGVTLKCKLGTKWTVLDLSQIADVRLRWLSVGGDVVWALGECGSVFMRQGPTTPPTKNALEPAWIRIDTDELKDGAHFTKIYVGNQSRLVWAVDSLERVFVREAIFPDFCSGTSWSLVDGLGAQSLAISDDKVFALTPLFVDMGIEFDNNCLEESRGALSPAWMGGGVFERVGLSSTNYVGDSWRAIPLNAKHFSQIAASVDNRLWCLDSDSCLWRLDTMPVEGLPDERATTPESTGALSAEENSDWLFV